MSIHALPRQERQEPARLTQVPGQTQVKPFPSEVLPGPIRRFIEEGAEAICCPADFLGVPILVAAAAAIGTSRVLRLKVGWEEGPRFFAAIVGDPGTRKSPALRMCLSAFFEKQKQYLQQYTAAKELYAAKMVAYELENASWQKLLKTGEADPTQRPMPPEEPTMPQVLTTDYTIEALALLLAQNPRGILVYQDELAAWVRSMDQYRSAKGADRQHWLSLWAGAPIIVNRKTQETVVISNPLVNIVGGLPPDVLPELQKDREDGFVQRILFAYPDPVPLSWSEAEISLSTLQELWKIFDGLWRLSPSRQLSFTNAGKAMWVDWAQDHYAEYSNPNFPEYLSGAWTKMEAYAARLALVVQELRYVSREAASEDVDELSMAASADLIDYFKSHAKRVYAYLRATTEDKAVNAALRWIAARGGRVTIRDIVRANVAGIKKQSEALSLVKNLQDRGHGVIICEGKTIFFKLLPDTPDN